MAQITKATGPVLMNFLKIRILPAREKRSARNPKHPTAEIVDREPFLVPPSIDSRSGGPRAHGDHSRKTHPRYSLETWRNPSFSVETFVERTRLANGWPTT